MGSLRVRIAALLALAVLLAPGALALADGADMLQNGDFAASDGTTPDGWTSDCWDREQGLTTFSVDATGGPDGSPAAVMKNGNTYPVIDNGFKSFAPSETERMISSTRMKM